MSDTQYPMRIAKLPVTAFQQNCSLLWCTKTMKAALVDVGGDLPLLREAIARAGVTVEKLLVTHGHIDHCGATGEFAAELGVPIEGPHEADRFWIARMADDSRSFGISGKPFEPDRWLVNGDQVTVGDLVLDVYHCPGHTPGHVVFHHPESRFAFVGDVLFAGSIGRTDFPLGNHADLIASITQRLWPLGEATMFMPGHGELSTFGVERERNGFVSDAALGKPPFRAAVTG